MPQLDISYCFNLLFWCFSTFALLYFTVGKVFCSKISNLFRKREDLVKNYLDQAKETLNEVEALEQKVKDMDKEMREKLIDLGKEYEEKVKERLEKRNLTINQEVLRRKEKFKEDLAEIGEKFSKSIAENHKEIEGIINNYIFKS